MSSNGGCKSCIYVISDDMYVCIRSMLVFYLVSILGNSIQSPWWVVIPWACCVHGRNHHIIVVQSSLDQSFCRVSRTFQCIAEKRIHCNQFESRNHPHVWLLAMIPLSVWPLLDPIEFTYFTFLNPVAIIVTWATRTPMRLLMVSFTRWW